MNHPEISTTTRSSRQNQMKSNFHENGVPLSPIAMSLKSKSDVAFAAQQIQRNCVATFFIIGMFAVVQPVSAQQTVHIGGKRMVPEVVVNLSAVYEYPKKSFKQQLPSNQRDLRPNFRDSRLLIPNLRRANKPSIYKLSMPGAGVLAVSRTTTVPVKRTVRREASTANVQVAPTVTLPSLPIKARDVLVAALPSLPQITDNDQSSELKPSSGLKKSGAETKLKTANEKPKLMRMSNVLKAPAKPAIKRLTPPPPPSLTTIIDKSKLRTPKASIVANLNAKKLKGPAANSTLKSKPKLDQLATLHPEGERMLEVRFRSGSSVLTRHDEKILLILAQKLRPSGMRLQLKAFAESTGNNSSKARRLSLSRALAVRSFLIENGLRSTRIDVRALGIARDGGAADRVDVVSLAQ